MDFKHIYTSSKTYIVLLIIAILLLLVTTSMTYRQIMLTQKSAEMVVHTLQVYNALGDLTTHYTKAESEEFREDLIRDKSSNTIFDAYKLEGKNILDSLTSLTQDNNLHTARIKPLTALLSNMYSQLINLDTVNNQEGFDAFQINQDYKLKINKTLSEIKSIKNRMLKDEQHLMHDRKLTYTFHKSLTPNMLLILAFFALLVFIISFFRIYNNKLKIRKSEAFLQNVLATTDNIVNYYEPIYNSSYEIIDFKIIYANDCNRDYLGLEPNDIVGNTVLTVYPLHKTSKELEVLIESFKEKSKVIFDRKIDVEGKDMWFHSLATPLAEGVLVTCRNSTPEEEAKEVEFTLKKRLEDQNLKLLDNRALLTNIFKSISHIVMHFKSIRGKNGKIIDFEILFVNDKISPVTGDLPDDIKNRKLSEVFPDTFNSGVFEHLVNAIENDKVIEYEVPYNKDNTKWFKATAIKLGDGVTVTTRDVTDEKEKAIELVNLNEKLLNSNLELKNRNAELESFNRVASHDLQEPLRKIQLFALRIQDTEAENFSDKSKEYFIRVIKAVNRMQSLIENLLAYSKINITKKDFEKVDLNQVLDKVMEDLVTSIHNSQTEIISDQLPKIKGVVFQIEQLFTNLIANAIKYKNADKSPKIQIHYSKVSATEIPGQDLKGKRQYHKISFVDNGIGFKQEYAEKIFEVFQRLHQKTEYTGTGIGLAICKKIVENHNGYIIALGNENEGAQFTMYLPAE